MTPTHKSILTVCKETTLLVNHLYLLVITAVTYTVKVYTSDIFNRGKYWERTCEAFTTNTKHCKSVERYDGSMGDWVVLLSLKPFQFESFPSVWKNIALLVVYGGPPTEGSAASIFYRPLSSIACKVWYSRPTI